MEGMNTASSKLNPQLDDIDDAYGVVDFFTEKQENKTIRHESVRTLDNGDCDDTVM